MPVSPGCDISRTGMSAKGQKKLFFKQSSTQLKLSGCLSHKAAVVSCVNICGLAGEALSIVCVIHTTAVIILITSDENQAIRKHYTHTRPLLCLCVFRLHVIPEFSANEVLLFMLVVSLFLSMLLKSYQTLYSTEI